MTLYGLIASCVWAGVVLYALYRVIPLVDRRFASPEDAQEVVVPLDLQAFAARFTSDWAKADAMKTIRERYDQHRDWNLVRRAVGLGVIDE